MNCMLFLLFYLFKFFKKKKLFFLKEKKMIHQKQAGLYEINVDKREMHEHETFVLIFITACIFFSRYLCSLIDF